MVEPGKPWYRSKTLWFAVLTVVVGVAGAFGFFEWEPDPQLEPLLQGLVVVVVGLINLILRLVTKDPIARLFK